MSVKIGFLNGLPGSNERRAISKADIANAKLNNVFHLQGTNPTFPGNFPNDKDIIVFLEYVYSSGTFTIEGNEIGIFTGAILTGYDVAYSPLRLDGGVKLNGTILSAKGFFLPIK